jgi:[ribosomal protein S5]-alanine N-acetyltransferase
VRGVHDDRQVPILVQPALPAGTFSDRRQPELVGEGVTLRPWTQEDAAGLVCAYSDPDIQRWHCRSLDSEEAALLINQWRQAWQSDAGVSWAAIDRRDGRVLGRAGFNRIDLSQARAEVAYWVLPAARGQGVATAAVTALSRWAFDEVGFQRLELVHSVENTVSCKVATATGFTTEGTMRQSMLNQDGWHDSHLHARLCTELEVRQ